MEELELEPFMAGSTEVRGGDTPLTSTAGGGGGRHDTALRPSARPVPVLGLGPGNPRTPYTGMGNPPLATGSSFADGPGRADTRHPTPDTRDSCKDLTPR